MKSIGLFFGSFNPIHLGHTRLAEYILAHAGMDEIWFVVSPRNPLKASADLLHEHLRLQMLELAIAGKERMKASTIEFELPKPSYTLRTLQALTKQYPHHAFTLLIGSDNMQIFDQWKDYRTILHTYAVLVYPRKGFDYKPFDEKYPEMQLLKDAPCFDISSTEIRTLIKKDNREAAQWLHPDVYRFILQHRLYL